MNLNYRLGRRLYGARDRVLRRRLPWLDSRFPRGVVFPLDLARFAADRPIETIVDVGANDGGTSLSLAGWFPKATIHAFEPVSETFEILKRRTASFPRITPHPLACGETPGEVRIRLSGHSTTNTLVGGSPADGSAAGEGSEVVRVVRVDAFAESLGVSRVDLLKTDAEGFDLDVLRGAEGLFAARRVRFVYAEVGFNGRPGQTPFAAVCDHLRGRGFDLAGFYEPMRSGERRQVLSFCNALFVLTGAAG